MENGRGISTGKVDINTNENIVIGEIRGSEALDFLVNMSTINSGSVSSSMYFDKTRK